MGVTGMFVGMSKNFWALRVSFLQIKKSQATKLHQIPLFHTTLLPEIFLSYHKIISPVNVFIILQLSRKVYLCHKRFSDEKRERKTTTSQETLAVQIFHIINIAAFLSIPRCCSFSDGSFGLMGNLICLCDMWKSRGDM